MAGRLTRHDLLPHRHRHRRQPRARARHRAAGCSPRATPSSPRRAPLPRSKARTTSPRTSRRRTTSARWSSTRARGIALLVNNAAALPVLDAFEELTPERFRLGFEVDVFGTLAVTQAAAPRMAGGTVVNLVAARWGMPAGAAHLSISPSQAALTALTRNLAAVLAPRIAVHGLAPTITPAGGRRAGRRRPPSGSSSATTSSPPSRSATPSSGSRASARARSGRSTRLSSRW